MYCANYDWETKEYKPVLIYRQTLSQDIDALSGKLTTFEGSYFDYSDGDDVWADEEAAVEDDANPGTGGINFTDAELEKMEKEGSLVTAEEMLNTLKEMDIFALGENPAVDYSNCYYSEYHGYYIRNMNFSSSDTVYYIGEDDKGEPVQKEKKRTTTVYATINAETGALLSFSSSIARGDGKELTEANAKTLISKYVKQLAGDKADDFRLNNISTSWSRKNKDGTIPEDAYLVCATVTSPRYAYGIPSMNEDISIQINNDCKIIDYSIEHYDVKYPAPKEILTEKEVFDSYFDQIDYDLQYRLAVQKEKALTAVVYNPSHDLYIDAFSGKLTGRSGVVLTEDSIDHYTDLKKSKYKAIAEELENYGIVLRDEKGRLNADKYITREEFSDLMSGIGSYYYNRTGGDTALTRQFAAKILTNRIISEECAELAGVFKSPFSDVKETSKYVGYIAVANAMGYMEGKNGKFNPGAKITRGEALQMVYDRLSAQ